MSANSSASLTSQMSTTETISIVAEIISYAVGLVVTALLTNHLTAIAYSRVALGMYTLVIVYPLVMRGANRTIFSYLGTYLKESTGADASGLLSWEMRCLLFGTLAFLVLALVVAVVIYIFDPQFFQTSYVIVFAFICLAPFWSIISLQGNILLSFKQYKAYFTCNVVSRPLWLMIILVILVRFFGALDFKLVMVAYFVSYIITIIGQSIWLKIQPNVVGLAAIWNANISKEKESMWRKYSLELFVNLELYNIQATVGVYLLAFFSNNKTAAGVYSVVSSIVNLFLLITAAMSSILSPLIATKISQSKGRQQLQSILNSINLVQLVLGVIIYLIIFFFTKEVLNLFGSHYTTAVFILKIYAGIQLLSMFNFNGLTILNYSGNAKTSMVLNGIMLVLILIFGSLGAYYFNTLGVMVAVGVSSVLVYFIACGVVRKYYGLKVMSLL